jgi:hypothetical protein
MKVHKNILYMLIITLQNGTDIDVVEIPDILNNKNLL